MFSHKDKIHPDTADSHCLSDHHPFMINYGNNAICFVWNILFQMKGGNFFNNGFGCNLETEEQYISRLNHLAAQINSVIEEKNPAFICLQETPKTVEHTEKFISFLNKKYKNENVIGGITLYNAELYTEVPELTQKIKDIALTEGLFKRITSIVLLDAISKKKTLLINVHADFVKDIKNDVIRLHEAAKANEIDHIVFAGDFNRDLADHQPSDDRSKHDIYEALQEGKFNNLYVCSTPNASFMAQKDKESGKVNHVLETRDGCLTSMEVTVENMIQLNRPAAKISTLISDDLKNIPEGFNLETSFGNKFS